MNTVDAELLTAFEVHSPDRIQAVLDDGFDVRSTIDGKQPINALIEMYLRSDRFPRCLRLLLERGAVLDDPELAPVLLDDPEALSMAFQKDPSLFEAQDHNGLCLHSVIWSFSPACGGGIRPSSGSRAN